MTDSPRATEVASTATIKLAERERQAVELRRAGLSFEEIAERVGYANKGGAHKAVVRGLGRWMRESDEELRATELDRTDAIIARLWPQVDREAPDLAAVATLMRVMDYRARITGLYAPIKHDVGMAVKATVDTSKLDAVDDLREALDAVVAREVRLQIDQSDDGDPR